MKRNRNTLSGSIKAALAVGAIEAALAHTFGNAEPELPADESSPVWLPPAANDAEREAALVLPRKQATRDLARALQADLDRELSTAVGRALGVELTDPRQQLEGHAFECVTVEGEEGETYMMDGVPILWAGPITLDDDGDEMAMRRELRHLNAVSAASDATP
jgi:hypothetical protein